MCQQTKNDELKKALGYEYEEIVTEGNKIIIRKKYVPADVPALCNWLKRNKPDKWGR